MAWTSSMNAGGSSLGKKSSSSAAPSARTFIAILPSNQTSFWPSPITPNNSWMPLRVSWPGDFMKKLFKILVILVLVLIVAGLLAVHFFLDGAITKGFNSVGPTITKTDTRLDGVSLSIFSGSGKMKGLFIGNPEGYKGAAMQVASSSFAVQPGS